MTCKDCIYYKKCISLSCHGMGYDFVTGEYLTNVEKFCNSFKRNPDFAELQKTYNFGTTPEGNQFIEISDKTHVLRIYDSGVIEGYKNSELVCKIDPPKEHT